MRGPYATPLETLAALQRRLAESLHRCHAGCGAHVLRETTLCVGCDEKRRAVEGELASLVAMRIPSRLRWATFNAPELRQRVVNAEVIAKAKAVGHKGIDRIVLQGRAGMGKSVLATCILRQISIELGPHGYPKFFDGFELAVARAQSGLGEEAPDVQKAMRTRVLVFDDLGAGKISLHDATADIVFRRHAEQLSTVYTTGFSKAAIRAKFGDGIFRRIFEDAVIINIGPEPVET